jgi:hypothetical protein
MPAMHILILMINQSQLLGKMYAAKGYAVVSCGLTSNGSLAVQR